MSFDGIEQKEASLYSNNQHTKRDVTQSVEHLHRPREESAWQDDPKKEGWSFVTKLFLFTLVIAFCSAFFLYYKVMVKPVAVDNQKISILVDTNDVVEGGQENKALVTISNSNSLDLQSAVLVFSYDKGGTLGRTTEKVIINKTIGTIPAHGITKLEVPYTVFGQTNEEKKLYFTLSYQIKGSTGVFPKEETKSVRVSTPPLSVSMTGPDTALSGSEVFYSILISNPTATSSKQSLVTLSFPASFSLLSASEKESDKKYTYSIPSLSAGQTKEIKIRGIFSGKVGEKSSLRATVGKPEGQDENDDTTIYSYFVKGVAVRAPGLTADAIIDSPTGSTISVRKDEKASVILSYKNESKNKIVDIRYAVKIPESVDENSLSVKNGYFDSSSRSIVWNSEQIADFLELGAQKSGTLSFSFQVPKESSEDAIRFEVIYSGKDVTSQEEVSGSKDIIFKIKGNIEFSAYTLFYDIDSSHGGPIPPVVDKETKITGVLSISSDNGIKDPKVVLSIPSLYVKWAGGVGSSSISYDPRSKMVSWFPGTLDKGGVATVKFMLIVKPSLVHLGTTPALSSQVVLTGIDSLSGEKVTQTAEPLSTAVKDGGKNYTIGIVIK